MAIECLCVPLYVHLNCHSVVKRITADTGSQCGQISPIWQTFKILCQFLEGLFSFWQHFEPPLAK